MLVKNIFRKEVKQILLEHMIQGKMAPGSRISLPKLAAEMEVSVTPIREALTQLTEIGTVTYIANRGFFVTELSEKEATDIFETIALLEGEALLKSKFQAKQFQQLHKVNRAFEGAESSLDRLKLDMEFHQLLIANFSNIYIKKIIEDIRVRVFLYEHEFMDSEPVEASVQMHDALLGALQAGELEKARQILQQNWQLSSQSILRRYQSPKS